MSLGLPAHLAPQAVSRWFVRGLHAIGFTTIIGTLLITIAFQAADTDVRLWPAMIALGPMFVALWLADRRPTAFNSGLYLAVGAACSFWFAATFYSLQTPLVATDAFSVALLKVALVMVGGPRGGLGRRIAWCVAGYAVAEASVDAAILVTGHPFEFDVTTLLAFLVTMVIFLLNDRSRRLARRSQPQLHRAARDEELASMRYRIEVRAAALLHDTVLSHLAAIASATDGPLNPVLRAEIERDLEVLIGEEWLGDELPKDDEDAHLDWRQSGLFAAIQESRALGLEVEATGDLTVISRLDRETSYSLGLAVKQCLVNVLKHADTNQAEVAVYGSETEISVMVIDTGRGFTESETGADRLGLRQSVRRRIESVGGAVQVWSTPGRGTSIMIRVPALGGHASVRGAT
ncbi:ATP-binding protein [Glaciihabitans sp. UYNi722]|uniref:sensor histidine kinase n=1 Tax=Glaciihabitans sp. UYNi722 TaxID=3156344 RepID=UPI0033964801